MRIGLIGVAVGTAVLLTGCADSAQTPLTSVSRTSPSASVEASVPTEDGGSETVVDGDSPMARDAEADVSPAPGLDRMVGSLVISGVDRGQWVTPLVRRMVERGHLGGVIIMDTSARDARPLIDSLQSLARRGGNPSLLVAVDQEGGRIRRFSQIGPRPTHREYGALPATRVMTDARVAGCALRRQGVTLNLAPVTDVAVNPSGFLAQSDRSFGSSATLVGSRADAYVRGIQDGGVGATLKHFPGLGAAGRTTDDSLHERLGNPSDVPAFIRAAGARPQAIMLSSATYGSGPFRASVPAFANPSVVRSLRRSGFQGLIITDDLATRAIQRDARVPEPAVAAIAAGADMVLSVDTTGRVADGMRRQIIGAVRGGRLPRSRVEDAWRRGDAARREQREREQSSRC